MSDLPEYNGWANYPTWAVFTWLSNDERDYTAALEQLEGLDGVRADNALKEYVESIVFGDEVDAGIASDLLGFALAHVAWNDVVDGLREE